MSCENEISCQDQQLSEGQLFRKLIRKVNDCFSIAVYGSFDGSFTASSTERTPSRTSVGTSGSVAAGARSVSFETSSDFSGTILGVTAQPDRVYDFAVQQNDDTLGAIAYTVTAGSIIITKIV